MDINEELSLLWAEEAVRRPNRRFRRLGNEIRIALEETGTGDPSKLEMEDPRRHEERLACLVVWQTARDRAVRQWMLHHAGVGYGMASLEAYLVALRDLFSGVILPWIGEEIAIEKKAAAKSAGARANKARRQPAK